MGRTADLPRLAEELVAARVEALVTIGYPPAVAAKAAGIPTVAASGVGDPVATGLRTTSLPPGYVQ
jgi:putative ABC transport system substrate-binding protein